MLLRVLQRSQSRGSGHGAASDKVDLDAFGAWMLPKGRALQQEVWERRHRGVLILLWAHAVAILAIGVMQDHDVVHRLLDGSVVAGLALAAGQRRGGRRLRAVLASLGLLSTSAILVHLSGGTIEMHFHFFVMLGVIALYHDWSTYLLAVGFVLVHHGTVGVLDPQAVYNHPAAQERPWVWGGIHAAFILASSLASLVAWRLNEQYRAQADRAAQQEAIAKLGRRALSSPQFDVLAEEAVGLLARTLEADYVAVLELRPELGALLIRSSVGWAEDAETATLVTAGPQSHAGSALAAGVPVVVHDLRGDSRFPQSHLLRERGVVSGASVVIPGPDGPYGVLSVHTTRVRSFDAHDLNFLEALANTLGAALLHRHSQGQLLHQALHDPLTDLPNRALFQDRLDHALARATRDSEHTAVALLDLDDFKAVNDSLGHAVGDELLVAVARRISDAIRADDTVARLGGDEFAILLEETVEVVALGVTDRVLEALRQPLIVAGRPVMVQASIGIASSRDAEDGTALVRNADLAMYAAKSAGRARIEVFHPGMHEAVLARLELETDLRHALEKALEDDQFHLLYQPRVSISTQRMSGVEALVRWEHPERGVVSPLDFIPLAEDTGLIVPIGAWILEEACRQGAKWQASSPAGLPIVISVNVSARQFEPGLIDTVRRALTTTGMDPARLCLELTETALMHDVGAAVETLHALKALGVTISVDDFGTGYSSLTYLKQFPLDELKIDKSFVDGLVDDPENEAIVAAIIGMAHALGLSVVAEGVETEAQARKLQALGCEVAQGFYFSRPKPAAAIEDQLRQSLAEPSLDRSTIACGPVRRPQPRPVEMVASG